MPHLSYIVTVYNKRPYLPFMLAGLAAQRGDFEREFIFVDDGSTDGSGDCLLKLTQGWPGVTLITQTNQGPGRALNRGLAATRGELIKPMDADDILLPDASLRLMAALTTTGQALAFGEQGDYRVDAPGGAPAVLAAAPACSGPLEVRTDALKRTLRRAQTTPSAWLASAAVVRKAGGCDPGVFVQDYSLELRISRWTGFAHLAAPVFLAPELAPGRLSEQEAQTLHDLNLAVCHFLADARDLAPAAGRAGRVRVLARAWAWRRRHEPGATLLSPEFGRYALGRLGFFPKDGELALAACATFRRTHPIRVPPAAAPEPDPEPAPPRS